MQDEPTPCEILGSVVAFLRQDVLPQLSGNTGFQLRVSINALELVIRELAIAPDVTARENAMLADLLGLGGETAALTAELAQRIADCRIDSADPALVASLWAITQAKLDVDQPDYSGLARARALLSSPTEKHR